jgi:GT2 family glycosyltransferase
MRPLLSIIIPVRDQAPRLRLTLSALRRQRGMDLRACEVLVVDDGSRDRVAEVVSGAGPHPFHSLSLLSCRSGGARGLPRNLAAHAARGEVLVFLDADACPGEDLLQRHLAVQRQGRCAALGDIYVVPGTERLLDPSTGVEFPGFAAVPPAASPSLIVHEESWANGVEAFLLAHAEQGSYAGLGGWHRQLEQLLASEGEPFAWMGVIPHNLSLTRADFVRVGGFDAFLAHCEGWDLGLRLQRLGVPIRFAPGARTFHLFHWRPLQRDLDNIDHSHELLCQRYPQELPQAAFVWFAAARGEVSVPAEMNLDHWRSAQAVLSDPDRRRAVLILHQSRRWRQSPPQLMDYLDGIALNSPLRRAAGPIRPPGGGGCGAHLYPGSYGEYVDRTGHAAPGVHTKKAAK